MRFQRIGYESGSYPNYRHRRRSDTDDGVIILERLTQRREDATAGTAECGYQPAAKAVLLRKIREMSAGCRKQAHDVKRLGPGHNEFPLPFTVAETAREDTIARFKFLHGDLLGAIPCQ